MSPTASKVGWQGTFRLPEDSMTCGVGDPDVASWVSVKSCTTVSKLPSHISPNGSNATPHWLVLVMVTVGTGEPDLANCALPNSITVELFLVTHRSPEESKARPMAPLPLCEIVTLGAGETLVSSALLYSTTLLLSLLLATQRSPEESNVRPVGPRIPLVIMTIGRALPVALGG